MPLPTLLQHLTPSFLHARPAPRKPPRSANNTTTQNRTLTGLKAYASLIVYTEHLAHNITPTFSYGHGAHGFRTAIQIPPLRLIASGLSMVYLFCVVSGYVLSYRVLELARRGEVAAAYDRVAGLAFRRGFRLFGPALVAVLVCAVAVQMGVFEPARRVKMDGRVRVAEELVEALDGVGWQVWDALGRFVGLLAVWNWDTVESAGPYDLHTWTLPVEFRCSMVLFLVLVVVCRFTAGARFGTVVSIICFALWSGIPEVACTLSGMVLAELDLIRHTRPSRSQSTLALLLFLAGTYLSSIPFAYAETDPFYAPLLALLPDTNPTPKGDYIRSASAVLLVYSALRSPHLRPLFTNTPTQYLGKISFAIYLVHGNVLKAVLYPLLPVILGVTGDGTQYGQTQLGSVGACVLGAGVTLPVIIWLADVFWTGVEVPIGRGVEGLERVLIGKKAGSGKEKVEWLKA